jgi:RNAPII transcription regulator C-terminal
MRICNPTDARNRRWCQRISVTCWNSLLTSAQTNKSNRPTDKWLSRSWQPQYDCKSLPTILHSKRQRIQSLKLGPALLLGMLQIATEPDEEDLDEDTPVRLAITNIDILSTSLPPTHVAEPLLQELPKLAQSPDLNQRRAAMASLGAVMEGALEYISTYIENLLPLVLAGLRDSEHQVVRAALIALGQIAEELPTEVTKHHSTLVPIVFDLLMSRNSEIMKAAINSLDAILEFTPKDAVVQYLPKLMEALLRIMTTDIDPEIKIIVAGTFPFNEVDISCHWNRRSCVKRGILSISRYRNAHFLQLERSSQRRKPRSPRNSNRYPRNPRQRSRKGEIPPLHG